MDEDDEINVEGVNELTDDTCLEAIEDYERQSHFQVTCGIWITALH